VPLKGESAPAASVPAIRIENTATAPPGWDDLVEADGSCDYPHTAYWNECAARALPGALPCWLTARQGDRLVAGLVAVSRATGGGPLARRRLDSSVEGTSCGPLVARDLPVPDQAACVRALLTTYRGLLPGPLGAVTFALGPERERRFGSLAASMGGWTRHESPTAVIDLEADAETVALTRLSNSKRNERNRGLKRGAVVTATRDQGDLAEYYPLYAAAATNWGIVPTPLSFLQALLADPLERVFFTCVRCEGRVIGGHLNLHLGDRVFAWNGVSDPAVARSHFPGTLCMWGDIVESCRRGARQLDIGASGGITSLEGFKRYFGAGTEERGYYVCEGAALRAVRATRVLLGRPVFGRPDRGVPGHRWHDGRTGAPHEEDTP
jgi:hypothetical protein